MCSYMLSPIVLAFFVGPQWDSVVGIYFHGGKMKIDWPVYNLICRVTVSKLLNLIVGHLC